MPVSSPDLTIGRSKLDFGRGFYTTVSRLQAERWAERQFMIRKTGVPTVSEYLVSLDARSDLLIKEFTGADSEWLASIVACRRGEDVFAGYDVVIGPVADDNIYETIRFYETGVYDETETLRRLKVEKLYNQVVFKTEAALSCCKMVHG